MPFGMLQSHQDRLRTQKDPPFSCLKSVCLDATLACPYWVICAPAAFLFCGRTHGSASTIRKAAVFPAVPTGGEPAVPLVHTVALRSTLGISLFPHSFGIVVRPKTTRLWLGKTGFDRRHSVSSVPFKPFFPFPLYARKGVGSLATLKSNAFWTNQIQKKEQQ